MDTYFLRCKNGHFYEADRYEACPYCRAEADDMPFPADVPIRRAALIRRVKEQCGMRIIRICGGNPVRI